jgi:hypothetical protein
MVDPIVLPVTMTRELPRFVIPKDVAGRERYYWTLPSYAGSSAAPFTKSMKRR